MSFVSKVPSFFKAVATRAAEKVVPTQAQNTAAPRQEARALDTYTPAQAPKGAVIDGYGKPVDAKDLPDPGSGVGVMTLNTDGASDHSYAGYTVLR